MIMRSISICLRCQKGGEPASRVYMITPVLHLWAARSLQHPCATPRAPSWLCTPGVAQPAFGSMEKQQGTALSVPREWG